MTTPRPARELLSFIVMVCTAVALIVLVIDMQIKKDLLRIGNQAHDDLMLARTLLRKVDDEREAVGLPGRFHLPGDPDGDVPRADVAPSPATVEAQPVGDPSEVAPVKPTRKRANRVRSTVDTGVPSTDK